MWLRSAATRADPNNTSKALEYLAMRDGLSVGDGSGCAATSPGGPPDECVSLSFHHFRAMAAAAYTGVLEFKNTRERIALHCS